MNETPDVDEVKFARALVNPDKGIRDKTLATLRRYIAAVRAMTDMEMLKLWKALYYCMWLSDKQPVQFELAKRLTDLCDDFHTPSLMMLYVRMFYRIMQREWSYLDQYRVNKFYTLIRYMVRKCFVYLYGLSDDKSGSCWPAELTSTVLCILQEEVLTKKPNGIRFHIADIFLSELHAATQGDVDSSTFVALIQPFLDSVVRLGDDKHFIERVHKKVFVEFATMYAPEIRHNKEEHCDNSERGDGEDSEEQENTYFMRVNTLVLQKAIFDQAAAEATPESYRKQLYDTHKVLAHCTRVQFVDESVEELVAKEKGQKGSARKINVGGGGGGVSKKKATTTASATTATSSNTTTVTAGAEAGTGTDTGAESGRRTRARTRSMSEDSAAVSNTTRMGKNATPDNSSSGSSSSSNSSSSTGKQSKRSLAQMETISEHASSGSINSTNNSNDNDDKQSDADGPKLQKKKQKASRRESSANSSGEEADKNSVDASAAMNAKTTITTTKGKNNNNNNNNNNNDNGTSKPSKPSATAAGNSSVNSSSSNTPPERFLPSKVFAGRKVGYVFQRGKEGMGYYWDAVQARRLARATVDGVLSGSGPGSGKKKKRTSLDGAGAGAGTADAVIGSAKKKAAKSASATTIRSSEKGRGTPKRKAAEFF